eukprot:3300916-Amphidinium_carterae.1
MCAQRCARGPHAMRLPAASSHLRSVGGEVVEVCITCVYAHPEQLLRSLPPSLPSLSFEHAGAAPKRELGRTPEYRDTGKKSNKTCIWEWVGMQRSVLSEAFALSFVNFLRWALPYDEDHGFETELAEIGVLFQKQPMFIYKRASSRQQWIDLLISGELAVSNLLAFSQHTTGYIRKGLSLMANHYPEGCWIEQLACFWRRAIAGSAMQEECWLSLREAQDLKSQVPLHP